MRLRNRRLVPEAGGKAAADGLSEGSGELGRKMSELLWLGRIDSFLDFTPGIVSFQSALELMEHHSSAFE